MGRGMRRRHTASPASPGSLSDQAVFGPRESSHAMPSTGRQEPPGAQPKFLPLGSPGTSIPPERREDQGCGRVEDARGGGGTYRRQKCSHERVRVDSRPTTSERQYPNECLCMTSTLPDTAWISRGRQCTSHSLPVPGPDLAPEVPISQPCSPKSTLS